MFALYESAIHYHKQKGKIYVMLYDLEKAFDNIEYNVFLDHLYQSGVNAQMWHLVKSWYSSPTNWVQAIVVALGDEETEPISTLELYIYFTLLLFH